MLEKLTEEYSNDRKLMVEVHSVTCPYTGRVKDDVFNDIRREDWISQYTEVEA